jgi:4-amino-4-deoxy-L-arabinose transferase-like glycosyltransferase
MLSKYRKYRQHLPLVLMVLIIALASWLRVWQLNTQMIFFGDAAHDMLTAHQALLDRQLPLLGIESSVPRFRQGPVAIWIIMLAQLIFGLTNTYAIGLVFALISVLAVIGLYELLTVSLNQKTGLIASALLAVSPMAVAHGRVPYHTTPIPLAVIGFLWAMKRLWDGKKWAIFTAFFSCAVAFQFELALFPLIGVPIYILWRQKRAINRLMIGQAAAGLTVGLLPQVIFDLTHRFQHLGGFAVWVVYRIAAFGGFREEHAISINRLINTGLTFWHYSQRIFSVEQPLITAGMLGLLLASLWMAWRQHRAGKLPPIIEISLVSVALITVAYVIHGSPSEAYFPPFLILWPLLIGYLLAQLSTQASSWNLVIGGGLTLYLGLMVFSIIGHNFFVGTSHQFSYGPAISEYRQVINYIASQSENQFSLNTTAEGGEFASYFDNLRWAHLEQGHPPVANPNHLFYVERQATLDTYPTIKKVTFNLMTVYQLL